MVGPGAGVRGRNSLACAESQSIAERVTRLRGCVSTQVIQPGGETAKVRGGARGPMDRAGPRGSISHPEFLIGFRVFEDGVNPFKPEASPKERGSARGRAFSVFTRKL